MYLFVQPRRPRENIARTVVITLDGWCGYRTLAYCVNNNQDADASVLPPPQKIYFDYFPNMREDLNGIEQALAYAVAPPQDAIFCPFEHWFFTPGCAQVATDTCNLTNCSISRQRQEKPKQWRVRFPIISILDNPRPMCKKSHCRSLCKI